MRRISCYVLASASMLIATGCSDFLEPGRLSGLIGISAPSVFASDTKSSEDNGYSFRYESAQDFDIDITVTSTVSPMSVRTDTKASERTTANLDSFIMDGFLGDEITTCEGATDEDKNNRHFMVAAEAQKNTSGVWNFVTDQKWRSCVTHYFWAHTDDLTDFSVSGAPEFNQADFSFENDGKKDLLVANHVQYYDDVLPENRNDDYITGLTFHHALSEVVINTDQVELKQFDINGSQETPSPARCSIEEIGLISYNKGNCTLNNDPAWSLSWSDLDSPGIQIVSDGNVFVIPQDAPNLTSMLYIYDNKRLTKLPIFIKLGGVSGAPESLAAGSKYTYDLKGTVIAPYWDGVYGIHAAFSGKDFQHFCVLKDLASKYVKKVKVSWTGMAKCQSAGTIVWMGYETGNSTPTVENYPTTAAALATEPRIGFAAKFSRGGGTPDTDPLKGTWTKVGSDLDDWTIEAEFDLTDVPANTPVSFYLVYDGGNNSSQATWRVKNLSIEVTEFKIPVNS